MSSNLSNTYRFMDAATDPTRKGGCEDCGETDEFSPNIEAFETFGRLLCDECSEAAFEAASEEEQ